MTGVTIILSVFSGDLNLLGAEMHAKDRAQPSSMPHPRKGSSVGPHGEGEKSAGKRVDRRGIDNAGRVEYFVPRRKKIQTERRICYLPTTHAYIRGVGRLLSKNTSCPREQLPRFHKRRWLEGWEAARSPFRAFSAPLVFPHYFTVLDEGRLRRQIPCLRR